MAETSPSVMRDLLSAALPYADPLRRRRIRDAARRLVVCEPWPGDDALPLDVSQLALIRLLWLQREAHRAARRRQVDACALLARTSVETCIAGLYWLYVAEDLDRMRGHNAKSLRRMLAYMVDGELITQDLIDRTAETIGPSAELPTVRDMANAVSEKTGESFAADLYDRVYVPLSTFLGHAGAPALLLHVGTDGHLHETPLRVWSSRSARHAVDACMARLAVAIAERTDNRSTRFAAYAIAHTRRWVAPVGSLTMRAALHNMHWSKLPGAVKATIDLRRYLASEEAAQAPYAARRTRAERSFDEIVDAIGVGPSAQRKLMLDYFIDKVLERDDNTPTP